MREVSLTAKKMSFSVKYSSSFGVVTMKKTKQIMEQEEDAKYGYTLKLTQPSSVDCKNLLVCYELNKITHLRGFVDRFMKKHPLR